MTTDEEVPGFWEREGRSLNAAVAVALTCVGALYFTAQSIIMFVVEVLMMLFHGSTPRGERLLDIMRQLMEDYANPVRTVLFVTQFLFILAPVIWIVRRGHTQHVAGYIRLKRPRWLLVALAMLATLATLPLNILLSTFFSRLIGMPPELEEIGAILFTAHSVPELLWLVLVIGVTPGICEEVLFRGYAQRTLARTIGWKAILVIGLVFGLYHMQPLGLVTLAGMGMLFGMFFHRSDNLFPSMAAHFANNTAIVLLYYFASGNPEVNAFVSGGMDPYVLTASTILAAASCMVYWILTKRQGTDSRQGIDVSGTPVQA